MAVIETGSSVAGTANVDSNYALNVSLTQNKTNAGFVDLATEQDAGVISGARTSRAMKTSISRKLAVGTDLVVFDDSFASTAQNTGVWKSGATTFVLGFASGYAVFNNGSATASGCSQIYQTYRTFSLAAESPIETEIRLSLSAAPPSNWTANFGLFLANVGSAPYTPADGVYFRINSTGVYGVVNYNGTETVSGLLFASASLPVNSNVGFKMVTGHNTTEFWYCGTTNDWQFLGSVATPAGNGQPWAAGSAPVSLQLNQPATASAAVQIKFSDITVVLADVQNNKPWPHVQAAAGSHAYQGQNGNTLGTTALYSNSLAAGAGAAATNTTAALGSGLGGQFSVQPTLTVGTDGIISSYQNPAGSAAIPPRMLYITGVSISSMVTTAFTGGPVAYAYSLAFGHTAVSLATAEAAATKAPRRIALGFENFVVTATAGTQGQGVSRTFVTPIPVNPGEFVQVVAKNVNTVTSAGVVTFLITFDGYFD